MSAEVKDTLIEIAEEIVLVFKPFQMALEGPDEFSYFMRQLGWDFSQIPTVIDGLRPVIESVINIVESGNFEMGSIGDLSSVISAIKAIKESNGPLPGTINPNEFKNEFPGQLLQTLTVDYLLTHRAKTGKTLKAIGIIRFEDVAETPTRLAYTKKEIAWNDIGNFFNDPGAIFANAYQWGGPDFKVDTFFANIADMGSSFGWDMRKELLNPAVQEYLDAGAKEGDESYPPALKWYLLKDEIPPVLSTVGLALQGLPETNTEQPGFALVPFAHAALEEDIEISEELKLLIELGFEMSAGLAMLVRPSGVKMEFNILGSPELPPSGIKAKLGLEYAKPENQPTVILGMAEGSRLEFKSAATRVGGIVISNGQYEVLVETELKGGKLVIKLGGADGFLQNILPEGGLEGTFDLTLGWSSKTGVYFKGGGGLEIEIPAHITLGPVELNGLQIGINPSSEGIPISLSSSITANLGPFVAVVERMGITANFDFADDNSGNLGPLDFNIGFKPPNGIGLSLDAGVVKGGGYLYFDFDNEEYAGALELSIQDMFVVTAIGVVTTRMPDGSKGFSMLLMVAVSFSPGIALGFGFFLSGLGGLIGLHRTVNVEALRLGVKSQTIDNIMFPTDVVKNISKIISDIKEIFPVKQDQFVLGFMAQITWGVPKLLTVEFGIIVEFTSPVRIAILGVLKCILPTEEASLLRLQVNFLGIIDFDNKYLSFDASIYNSKILTFTLEGDMALRINWGDNPGFLLSVGGFHPSYKPEESLQVPSMKRLTLSLLSGNPSLTLTCYFAVTSNTIQFSAAIDFLFKVSKFKVIGYFGFDVLFQFSPFKFIAGIRAGIKIMLGSTTLFSIELAFELQGPTPWIASGTASFKILFFTIKVKFKKTWGEKKDTSLPAVPVMPKVLEALNAQQNWIAVLPKNRFSLVSLREDTELEGEIVLNPYGTLTINQNVIPLDTEVSKYGNYRPQDLSKLDISSAHIGDIEVDTTYVQDNFAPSNFKEMKDSDKLDSPSFEKENSGVKLTGTEELHMNYHINRAVQYEVITSDHKPKSAQPVRLNRFDQLIGAKMTNFKKAARAGAIAKSPLSIENKLKKQVGTGKQVSLGEEIFKVVNTKDLSLQGIDFAGGSRAQATDAINKLVKSNPSLKGKVMMVPEYELQD